MNKVLLIYLCVILLLVGTMAGLIFLSKAVAQGDGIIVDGADYISTTTNEYSAELANIANEVTSRVIMEYGDFNSKLELNKSDELNQAASVVSSRIVVEYADFVSTCESQGSEALLQAATDVASRIIVEYADYIFSTDLEQPSFSGPQPILTFDLSLGWGTKELFVPLYYRSSEGSGTFVLGVHNRRDMWYLVKVYKKMPDKTWMEIIPDEFLKGSGPYLGPWSERTFLYTPQVGDEIKIQLWNDMNDGTLLALWGLDFVTRVLTGVRIPPKFLEYDWQTIKSKLNDFYNDVVKPVKDALLNKAWKTALIEMCKTILKAPQLYSSILIDLGFEPSVAAGIIVKIGKFIEGALRLFAFFVNIPTWKDLLENLNKEPFMEEVTFTARYKTQFVGPNLKVTKSLTILQREPYYVGQVIDAQFTITNKGTTSITFNILTVGGRGPKGDTDVRDFTFKTDIMLNAGGFYNYEGELKLLDNGTYHFFIAYQTPDGKWETSVPTEDGSTNTVDIFVNPIPEKWLAAELGSPAELRVYDSQGKITGLMNGAEKIEILHSIYYGDIVVILASADSYKYDVVGTNEGSYSLLIINGTAQEIATFNATEIPTSTNAIHRYTVDWVALTRGEKGVTIQIDSNGDGAFEKTFTSDNELTRDEFMSQIHPPAGFPMWVVGAAVAAIAIAAASTIVFIRRKRKYSPK